MKIYTIILLIFGGTFLNISKPLTNPVLIKGHLKKNPADTSTYISHLLVYVKGDNKILAKAITDDDGDFELTFTPNKEKSFDFYCNGIGVDTLLLSSITHFYNDTPEMIFYIPGRQKRDNAGKIICPKCNKTDKVYIIRYGDNPKMVRHISKTYDTTYSPLYKGTYQENCTTRPAKFYCDRDKVKF